MGLFNVITHKLYIDEDDCDDISRIIEVPFPLVPGIELMVGPSSDWTLFQIDTATWMTDRNEMVCWLKFTHLPGGITTKKARQLLIDSGWTDE